MKIRCLGGFREVGKNAVLVEGKKNVLFDFGMEVETGTMPIFPSKVDAIVLGHAHLDHSGFTPTLYRNKMNPTIYSTAATFDLAHLLLKDSIKIARIRELPKRFDKFDVDRMKKREMRVTYGQKVDENGFSLDIYDAGHIPGSASPMLDMDGKRILYVCDFNVNSTQLLKGASITAKDVDVLVLETTYSDREHSPREETEKEFFDAVNDTIANGGIAVIPSFAVGRSAEILMVLSKFKPNFPIYLDGMSKTASEITLKYPELLRDHKAYERAFKACISVWTDKNRKKLVKEPCAIVTSSGMLEGGPSVSYVKYLYDNIESSIIFTGFLIPETAGRKLFETGRFVTEGFDMKIKMGIQKFDFSAHSGRSDLFNFVKKINPKRILCMHGDNCEGFAKELKEKGYDAIAPKNGDKIEI